MPLDGRRFNLPYANLQNPDLSIGIGGAATQYQETAIVAFIEPGNRLCVYQIRILIQEPQPQIATVPSLLGRDIMQYWKLIADKPVNSLTAHPVEATHFIPIPALQIALKAEPGDAPRAHPGYSQ